MKKVLDYVLQRLYNTTMKIEIPTNCPSCDSSLELINDQLFCKADDCPAQSSKKLVKFCKTLKIKGFGEKTCEKLGFTDIGQLQDFSVEYAVGRGFSEKQAQNLENELSKVEQGVDFDMFLAALSIPLVGNTASKDIAQYCKSMEELITNMDNLQKAGVGPTAHKNITNWVNRFWFDNYSQKLGFIKMSQKKTVTSDQATKGDVCISGKLNGHTKAQATKLLNDAGYQVKSTLTKSCVYLISEDGKESSKVKKAKQTNITIKTLEEILNNG